MRIKNKACTFALPIGNNGSADGETTSSERFRATFFDMMKRAKRKFVLEDSVLLFVRETTTKFTMESLILAQDER